MPYEGDPRDACPVCGKSHGDPQMDAGLYHACMNKFTVIAAKYICGRKLTAREKKFLMSAAKFIVKDTDF